MPQATGCKQEINRRISAPFGERVICDNFYDMDLGLSRSLERASRSNGKKLLVSRVVG
jgi:hypothetical protein